MTNEQIVEMCRLSDAVDRFAFEMKKTLRKKLLHGHTGWDDPQKVSDDRLRTAIYHDAINMFDQKQNNKVLDIANRCMMLWVRQEA